MVLSLKMDFIYYSLKVKDQGKETSYTVFLTTKSKEVALFLQPNDEKDPLKGQMLFALNKKEKLKVLLFNFFPQLYTKF